MVPRRAFFIPFLMFYMLISLSCAYIVLPEGVDISSRGTRAGQGDWTGLATHVGQSDSGDLRIDIAIRNDTGDWSTMRAVEGRPARLTGSDGKSTLCNTVVVTTGGHRLAPGFQMRGYISGKSGQTERQLLHVACAGAVAGPGSTLSIDYIRFDGERDYFTEVGETNKVAGTLVVDLDEVATDLTYPIGTPIDDLAQEPGTEIIALSENVITLMDIQRSDSGFQFTWQNRNPSKFALRTRIGIPPVIGDDGIIYGVYETLDLADVPLTPAEGSVEWTTEVAVPADVSDLYILLSVESIRPRTYLNYLIDVTGQ